MKKLICLFLVMILGVFLAVPVLGAAEEADCKYIEKEQDVVFWVSWDKETPDVVFLAPNGTVFDPQQTTDTTVTIQGQNCLYYVVKKAAAGQWKIRYDKKSNEKLEVSVHKYNSGIFIDYFTMEKVENDRIPVKFLVSGQENIQLNYRISAVINHSGTEKELVKGTTRTGSEVSLNVRLNKLSSYDGYMLKLYVWYDDNGTDIFDFAFTDKFAYSNDSADGDQPEYQYTVYPEKHLISVEWPEISWNAENVLVAVFEDGAKEPTYFDEFDPQKVKLAQLGYDPAASQVDIECSVMVNGVRSTPVRKTFQVKNLGLELPDGDAFNTVSLPLKYKGFTGETVKVTVNGHPSELVFNGDGMVSITLGDEYNDLQVLYLDKENVNWVIERKIFVDRLPPVLNMSQTYDGMEVSGDKITVHGNVADFKTLTINGQAVEADKGGNFSYELTLKKGENTLSVTAADKLGNEAQYTAKIFSGVKAEDWQEKQNNEDKPGGLLEKLTNSYWPLVITCVLCVLIVVYAVIFWRKEVKK